MGPVSFPSHQHSAKSCNFGNRVFLQFMMFTMLLSWRLGKSAKAPHISARDFDQVWLNVTLKWTWGCGPHWSSCFWKSNLGEEASQLALFGGSPLWSSVLDSKIPMAVMCLAFLWKLDGRKYNFWKLELEKGGCVTCVCSRHFSCGLCTWVHCSAGHTVSHGLMGTSCFLPGLKREELLSVSNLVGPRAFLKEVLRTNKLC